VERRAKERLIGASLLVVLLVLVVPELLSGPKPAAPNVPLLPAPSANAPEPTRTVTVDLATSKSTAADSEGGPLDSAAASAGAPAAPATSAASVAEPVASAPTVASSVVAPKPLNSVPAFVPSRSVDSTAAAPTSSRDWAVQLGSFANRGNAEKLVRQLKSQGLQVYDSAIGVGQAQRFRVRVGPLPDRAAADRTIAKLKALGHAASAVPPAH
jgi:DedD protein